MRMSDIADTEAMKVSEAADTVSPAKDNATKSELYDKSQSSREEHGSNSMKDTQVNNESVRPLSYDQCLVEIWKRKKRAPV